MKSSSTIVSYPQKMDFMHFFCKNKKKDGKEAGNWKCNSVSGVQMIPQILERLKYLAELELLT